MALYNEILVGRFNRGLQKLLSMKGGPPSPQLSPEIASHFQIPTGVEDRYLFGWERFAAGFSIGNVAAQNSAFRIRNPATSNVVAVVEFLTYSGETADNSVVMQNNFTTDLASLATAHRIDSRSRPNPSCVVSNGNNVAQLADFIGFFNLSANATLFIIRDANQEYVIMPGDGIQLSSGQVNVFINGTIWWRERYLEESERT